MILPCMLYLITCNNCLKQYEGQTVDELRHRWNNYNDNSRKFERKEHCMQRHLFEHFNLPGFSNDVSVTLIDKTDPKEPTKRENYCNDTLKTKAPLGLNVEDGLLVKLVVFCYIGYVYGRTVFGK